MKVKISVQATAGAKRNQVGGQHDGRLKVSVTAPAEKGRANQSIIKLLAQSLGVAKSQIELVGGATSRKKVFEISDAGEDLVSRVADLMRSS